MSSPCIRVNLFEDQVKKEKSERLGKAIDRIEERFGRNKIKVGFTNKDVPNNFDYLIKIALLGDSSVGKTNLMLRFIDNIFSSNNPPTLGYDCKYRTIDIKSKKIKIQIWDTAGQERYLSLCKTVFQKVDGVMLVYDISELKSFDNISKWIELIRENASELPIILIGNKIDKKELRIVEIDDGKNLALKNGFDFMEVSALTGENVDKAFIFFAKQIVEILKGKPNEISYNFSIKPQNKNKNKKKKFWKC